MCFGGVLHQHNCLAYGTVTTSAAAATTTLSIPVRLFVID